jgi:O-antigen/teichoic acid export membrane protein
LPFSQGYDLKTSTLIQAELQTDVNLLFDSTESGYLSEIQAEVMPLNGQSNSNIAPDPPVKEASTFATPHALRRGLDRVAFLRRALSGEKGLSQGLYSLADQGVASITNFVSGVILARATSKQEFGLYMLAFSLILIVTDIQTSLIATPYMVYGPRLKGRASALYAGSTLIHQAVFSVLVMIAIASGAFLTRFGWGPLGIGPVLWVLLGVVSLIMFREFVRRMCFARLRVRSALIFDAGIGAAQVGGLLILAHLGLLTTNRAYWLIGTACGVGGTCWMWFNRASYRPRVSDAITDLKLNWTFGKWVFASGLLWAASTNLYPWLIAFFHGTAAAGVFAACAGVVAAGNPALLGIQNFVGPKIAHAYAAGGPQALRKLTLKISGVMALPVLALTVVLVIWGDRLVGLLYGSQYMGNRLAISILACNLPIVAIAFTFSRALFAIERADIDFWLNLIAVLMMATAGIWLVRSYGPLGAALGTLAATIIPSCARVAVFLGSTARSHVQTQESL